jgi:hypothetical protein
MNPEEMVMCQIAIKVTAPHLVKKESTRVNQSIRDLLDQ